MRIILIIFVFCSIEVVAQTTSMNLSDTNSLNAIKIGMLPIFYFFACEDGRFLLNSPGLRWTTAGNNVTALLL